MKKIKLIISIVIINMLILPAAFAGLSDSVAIKVTVICAPPQITDIAPQNYATFDEGESVNISPTVNNPGQLSLEYQFSVDGLVEQQWSGQSQYSWIAEAGSHSVKTEVRNTGGEVAEEVEVHIYRKPLQPPN